MKVALLDDDEAHNDLVARVLGEAGYDCVRFTQPSVLLASLRRQTFDLLVLDWNMPEMSGVELVERMGKFVELPPPVLMVTSRSLDADAVMGLNAGADDYIVKPVQRDVLLARVNALARRAYRPSRTGQAERYGLYSLDVATETVSFGDRSEVLTSKEFQLATLFFRNISRALSRDYLLERVWGKRPDLETRTVDAHVSHLRAKLALRPANGFRLATVYGFGYRLESCDGTAITGEGE